MRMPLVGIVLLSGLAGAAGCSDDGEPGDDAKGGSPGSGGASSGSGGSSGASGSSGGDHGGSSGVGGDGSDGGDSGVAGVAGNTGGAGGSGGNADGGAGEGGSGGREPTCEAERAALLRPVDTVSAGLVTVLSNTAGVRVLYVDATAGGFTQQALNPYTYVKLSTGARVDVTDPDAFASSAWDIALKRELIRVNGGDSGAGSGETGVVMADSIDDVTAANANGLAFVPDDFLDDTCEAVLDASDRPITSFSGWFEVDPGPGTFLPLPRVFLVKDASGATTYKLEVESYYSTPTGTEGTTAARYRLRYSEL